MFKLCLLLQLFCFSLVAQNPDFKIKYLHGRTGLPSIIEFSSTSTNIPGPENTSDWFINNLNASKSFSLRYNKTFKGQDGAQHVRYKQYYGRFPVESGEVILHQKNNKTFLLNGLYFPQLSVDTTISIQQDQALNIALNQFPISIFKWQIPEEERLLKSIQKNKNSTYLPQGHLLIYNTGVSADNLNFKLVYRFDLYSHDPHSRQLVYVDAKTGEVLKKLEQICSIDRVGLAYTRYSGVQSITCDSIAPDTFRLVEYGRGKGITTINGHRSGTSDSATDFFDSDNIWDNQNFYKDDVATDIHWGSEKTYDYYLATFGRNSYDDSGGAIFSRVHEGQNLNNAFWTGYSAVYGDGDGDLYLPFTSLDVCGHELSHGYTQYSADLIYQNESGALNESFSDIFGKCVEYANLPSEFNWQIGAKLRLDKKPLRNMEDPALVSMPKFYKGANYYTKQWDNGGVHTNSSIQNYWFYLLCEGGYGDREDNQYFRVDSIGIEKASKIAYLTLNGYLNSFAEYHDMCYLSIDAAISLYGENSDEVMQVKNAWFAVGLFDYFTEISNPPYTNKWTVFPNPSNGYIRLSNPDATGLSTMLITDITGQSAMQKQVLKNELLDVSSLASGIYFITMNGNFTMKFIRE